MDWINSFLQGGALVTIAGMIGVQLVRVLRREATREAWRRFRRNQTVRDLAAIAIVLAPYILAGAWLYQLAPVLLLAMLAAIAAGTVTIKTDHKRWGVVHLLFLLLISLAAATAVKLTATIPFVWGPVVVWGTAVFRDAWAFIRGDAPRRTRKPKQRGRSRR